MIDELSFCLWLTGHFNLYDLFCRCNFYLSVTTPWFSFQYTIPIELIGAKPTTRFAIMDAHCCSYGYLQLAPSSAVSLKWLPMNDPGLFVRAGRLHFGSGSLGLIFMPMRSIGRYTRRAIIPGRSPWVWNVCEAAQSFPQTKCHTTGDTSWFAGICIKL